MKEGGTGAPIRHPLDWRNPDFYDERAIDDEMRRVFDICHGCRRCFNLCDSFPRLFDLIDASETGELDSVGSEGFGSVVDACTLCDMCFMAKCPYVPPHEFNLDFPHLMLRYRAARLKKGERVPFGQRQLAKMDRNGALGTCFSGMANWGAARDNRLTRPVLEKTAGVDVHAVLPSFNQRSFMAQSKSLEKDGAFKPNPDGPARGRKAVLFATCFVNFNNAAVGLAARRVLAHLGVETAAAYPGCCAMPLLEQGHVEKVASQAEKVAAALHPWIEEGYDVITTVASCGLMFKFEWPLIATGSKHVEALAAATRDIDDYVVEIARKEGLTPGLQPVEGGVAVHLACHARAQNVGPRAADLLRLIPETDISVVERCSGHGGTFGVLKGTHEVAVKVGRPAARAVAKSGARFVASDCPLAAMHLAQGVADGDYDMRPPRPVHPIEIMAAAYGLTPQEGQEQEQEHGQGDVHGS